MKTAGAHPVPKIRGLGLTGRELRDVAGLSGIFALRLLGLFMLMPVLSVYALSLNGSTPMLAGMAVGAYAISQLVLQVPFGMLSDRWGRKKVIALGLAIYAAGSVVAAMSTSIHGLLLGRFLQGSGSIASVVIAMVADITREEVRGRAMAVVGMSIGASFAAGFLLGPVLGARYGVASLFWLLASLDTLAIFYLTFVIPAPAHIKKTGVSAAQLETILKDRNLTGLDALMFLLHLSMTSVFVVTPVLLHETWTNQELWKVYLPMILAGGLLMLPAMAYAESKKRLKLLLASGIAVCFVGECLLAAAAIDQRYVVAGIIVFFVGFNFIEPGLPSLVTRFAPSALRGTSVGVFNMSQFLGAACGGALGGFFLGHGRYGLYLMLAALCLPWMALALRLEDPKYLREVRFSSTHSGRAPLELRHIKGVYDAKWAGDGELEIRYSAQHLSEEGLAEALKEKGWL
jgi:MFS family permease